MKCKLPCQSMRVDIPCELMCAYVNVYMLTNVRMYVCVHVCTHERVPGFVNM